MKKLFLVSCAVIILSTTPAAADVIDFEFTVDITSGAPNSETPPRAPPRAFVITQDPAAGSQVSEEWCSEMSTRPSSLW